jgi:hypothetical protein
VPNSVADSHVICRSGGEFSPKWRGCTAPTVSASLRGSPHACASPATRSGAGSINTRPSTAAPTPLGAHQIGPGRKRDELSTPQRQHPDQRTPTQNPPLDLRNNDDVTRNPTWRTPAQGTRATTDHSRTDSCRWYPTVDDISPPTSLGGYHSTRVDYEVSEARDRQSERVDARTGVVHPSGRGRTSGARPGCIRALRRCSAVRGGRMQARVSVIDPRANTPSASARQVTLSVDHHRDGLKVATAEKGRPCAGRPFLVEGVGQRPLPKVGVVGPTVACCWMSCTHWW